MKIPAKKTVWRYFGVCLVAAVVTTFVIRKNHPSAPVTPLRDYAEINRKHLLRAVTEYNSIAFYADGDTVSGFYYALAQAFARSHGWQLDIVPEMTFNRRLEGLLTGKYDLIAYGIPVTDRLKDSLLFTTPIILSKQVLVQRRATSPHDSLYIRSQLDLAGRLLHVVKDSPAILRIANLSNEIGDTIYVKEVEDYGPEQLISLVAHGDIDYVVCDENVARAAQDSLPQIDIDMDISFTQFYAWGVSKESPVLLDSLNAWLADYLQTREYRTLRKKYFSN
ncbi:MAG: transporter substrate-binding domain-containing protein [Mediterranea sp.]|jgi:ABC-type amino acid transport substrate-binding protein|nr:transporter substrate-binding domain-containing protein [Mediterranea sp.]